MIHPPASQLERWEEQPGYSSSTLADDIARRAGDWVSADRMVDAGFLERVRHGVRLHRHQAPGDGSDSAAPLAWAHAEYVKLLRSLADGQVWDSYAPVSRRYAK